MYSFLDSEKCVLEKWRHKLRISKTEIQKIGNSNRDKEKKSTRSIKTDTVVESKSQEERHPGKTHFTARWSYVFNHLDNNIDRHLSYLLNRFTGWFEEQRIWNIVITHKLKMRKVLTPEKNLDVLL